MTVKTLAMWLSIVALYGVQKVSAETPVPGASISVGDEAAKMPSRGLVQQKLQLVKMMLSTSPVMQRASESDDEALKKQVAELLANYASANNLFNAGDMLSADKLADEVLGRLEDISRQAPDSMSEEKGQRTRYEGLLKDVRGAEGAYQDLRRRLNISGKKHEEVAEARKQSEDAQALAAEGNYREAAGLMKEAHAKLVFAVNKLLGSTVLTHELKFDTDADEYEYELARYHSYEELAPIAYVELKPDEFTIKLSERYVQESRQMRDTAKAQAERGEHREAIKTLLEAIRRMQTALRVLGLVLQE